MPRRAKSICRKNGCGALIDRPGFCDKHKSNEVGWNRSHQGATAEDRGYGPEWRKIRVQILRRDKGICQPCLREGRKHPATEVDHIVSKAEAKRRGWTQEQMDAEDNLQAINKECHRLKTEREREMLRHGVL